MQKIINNRRYDTDTAELLGFDGYSNPSDLSFWLEKLYRKRNGEYFLYGIGGPNSRYARTVGQNEWCGDSKIMPLTADAARNWAEKHLNAEEYEKIFGVVEESDDNEKTTWTIRVSPVTIERIRRIAGEKGIKLSEVVELAIMAFENCLEKK